MTWGKGALLWLLGIPLPIIILLALFWREYHELKTFRLRMPALLTAIAVGIVKGDPTATIAAVEAHLADIERRMIESLV